MRIRQASDADWGEITRVIDAAFADVETSAFTQELREWEGHVPELTFVAEDDGEIVGFTMLSYLRVDDRRVLNLTPMAVRPDRQRQGVGSALVEAAVAAADARREPVVLVEGVPGYYPRFGFRSATALGLDRPDDRIPDAAWMALPLPAYDASLRGRVEYPDFFPPPPDA